MLGFWDIGIPKLGTRCLFVRRSSKTSIYRYTDNLSHHLQHCSVLGPMGQHRCQHMDTTRNFNLGQARPDLIMSETTCSYVFHSGEGERERESNESNLEHTWFYSGKHEPLEDPISYMSLWVCMQDIGSLQLLGQTEIDDQTMSTTMED